MEAKKVVDRSRLCQRWIHSHEEDTDTEMVYRPADFAFPPSRGRTGFENRTYPQAAFLNDAFAAAAAIGSDQIDIAKLDGPEIGEKLRKLRNKTINEVKTRHKD